MSKQLDRWRWSYLIHPAVALGVTVIVGLGAWLVGLPAAWLAGMTPAFALFGYTREKLQHDGEELTAHQWVEAMNWSVGAALATVAWWPWL